jgi:hypothetical protein
LQYVSWKSIHLLRVFPLKGIYRRKGDVRRWTRWSHHLVARPGGGRATLWCGYPLVRLRLSYGLRLRVRQIGTSAFISSNFENISFATFLKHKNSRKQETGTVASR